MSERTKPRSIEVSGITRLLVAGVTCGAPDQLYGTTLGKLTPHEVRVRVTPPSVPSTTIVTWYGFPTEISSWPSTSTLAPFVQVPFAQAWFELQTTLQAPQLLMSARTLRQDPAHSRVPAGQTPPPESAGTPASGVMQMPRSQVWPARQRTLHPPQLLTSRSTLVSQLWLLVSQLRYQ